jgi:hypothetical protein
MGYPWELLYIIVLPSNAKMHKYFQNNTYVAIGDFGVEWDEQSDVKASWKLSELKSHADGKLGKFCVPSVCKHKGWHYSFSVQGHRYWTICPLSTLQYSLHHIYIFHRLLKSKTNSLLTLWSQGLRRKPLPEVTRKDILEALSQHILAV